MRALFAMFWCLPVITGWSHNFNGDWRCVSYSRDISHMAHDLPGDTEWFAAIGNLRIKDDMVYVFEYPCQYLGAKTLYQKNGQWLYKDAKNEIKVLSIQYDTLTIRSGPPFASETKIFIRDTLDSAVVQSLIEGKLNPTCLAGDWYLVRDEWCCYGSHISYDYPYVLQDTIHLDSAINSTCFSEGKYVVINVDGKRQRCTVDCSYDFVVGREALRLTPINSKKGKTEILYRRYQE